MPSAFDLNCLVLGDDPSCLFTVEIANNKTVSILRKLIKDEKKHAFEHVDADTLVLWKASIPLNESFKNNLSKLDLVEKRPLLPEQELVEIFTGPPPAKKHVHIVVKAPPIVTRPSLNSERLLELNCLVLGDDPGRVFPVKIAASESVGILRKLIKDEKKPAFDHVPADALVLWKVSIPVDENSMQSFSEHDFVEQGSLPPMEELSKIFTRPPAKMHVHIVVKAPSIVIPNLSTQPPPSKGSKLDAIDELSERLSFVQLENSQARVIQDALKAESPSGAAVLHIYRKAQEKSPILNGRPYTNRGIPIQLYHSSFAKFLSAVRDSDVQMDLKPEDYAATHSLFHSSATLYPDEAHRTQAIRVFLNKAIHHHISSLEIPGMRADGACQVICGDLLASAALEEHKNEMGVGGCDATHQCGIGFRFYYASEGMSPIRNNSCCPTFLVAVVGPWICILGAVFVDHVVIQELTDFIWIGGHPYDDDKLKSVTRILAALGKGITELEGFYANLPHHKSPDPQRFFPFIRQYSVGERIVRFSYKAYLLRKNPEIHAKPIFLATIESGGEGERSRDVVVKFVQTYNARAHRLLAAAGYAPELLYCSTEDPHSEDLGGLVMAIMEYVPGKTAHERYGNNPLPQAIFNQVRNAVETLHTENIVFADLRPPNIMVTGDERVMLIDFDWCGVHQKGTYPISLNDVQESDISIDWHPDVKRGGRMMKEHDIYRLNTMKPQS